MNTTLKQANDFMRLRPIAKRCLYEADDTDLAEFADLVSTELRIENQLLKDALIWMSGSPDFAPGGIAHQGWLKLRHLTE